MIPAVLTEMILVFLCVFAAPPNNTNFTIDVILADKVNSIHVRVAENGFDLFAEENGNPIEISKIRVWDKDKFTYNYIDSYGTKIIDLNEYRGFDPTKDHDKIDFHNYIIYSFRRRGEMCYFLTGYDVFVLHAEK